MSSAKILRKDDVGDWLSSWEKEGRFWRLPEVEQPNQNYMKAPSTIGARHGVEQPNFISMKRPVRLEQDMGWSSLTLFLWSAQYDWSSLSPNVDLHNLFILPFSSILTLPGPRCVRWFIIGLLTLTEDCDVFVDSYYWHCLKIVVYSLDSNRPTNID